MYRNDIQNLEQHYVRNLYSSRRRHTRLSCYWSSDVCSSDLTTVRWGRRPVHRGWASAVFMSVASPGRDLAVRDGADREPRGVMRSPSELAGFWNRVADLDAEISRCHTDGYAADVDRLLDE